MSSPQPGYRLASFRFSVSKWLLLVPALGCLAAVWTSIYYLTHSWAYLKEWYLGLNPCIYRAAQWPAEFFTPAVKSTGNTLSLIGLFISAILLFYYILRIYKRKGTTFYTIRLFKPDVYWLAALYVFAIAIWTYGFLNSYPSYDEVFSAVNCAGMHPFQAASYYMLPNNHVFFNFLNSVLFHFSNDKVLTGRIISGTCFFTLIPVLYYWLKYQTSSRLYAALFCAAMLLQFATWAFSFQARGYSIYLLCAWISFAALQLYLEKGNRLALSVHVIAIVIGFWSVPSFLFWELALAAYVLVHMIRRRYVDWLAIWMHLVAAALVFLVFQPVLCFSGKAALFENAFVKGSNAPIMEYLEAFASTIRSTIQYCFAGWVDNRNIAYLILFILPFPILPFIWKSRESKAVLFFILVWLMFTLMELKIQRYPFMRNMIAHNSITLAAVLLAAYALLKRILQYRWQKLQLAITAICCLGLTVHFVRYNRDHIHDSVYFYPVDKRYQAINAGVNFFPLDARVGCSDEGFYWEYLLHQRHIRASKCMGDAASYYVKMDTEPMPAQYTGRAEKWKQVEEYEIYLIK